MKKPLTLTLTVMAALSSCQGGDDTHEEIGLAHPRADNAPGENGSSCHVFGQLLTNGTRNGAWCCGQELCTDEEVCGEYYGEYVATCYACDAGVYECVPGEPTGNEQPEETCYNGILDQYEICYGGLTTLVTDVAPGAVVVTDVDQDGPLDVLTATLATVSTFVEPLSEEGTPSLFPLTEAAFTLAMADLDADGDNDIVAATEGAAIEVLMNDGAGSFSDPTSFELPANAGGLALADLRGQGNLDIIATIRERDALTTLFNDGAAGFHDSVTQSLAGEASAPGSVAATDLDGDGDTDLITSNAASGSISVLLNDGEGSSFSEQQVFGVGSHPGALALGDVNRDGNPDLVVADGLDLGVLFGSGDAGLFLNPEAPQYITAGGDPRSLALVDVNADGALDIVAANTEAGNLALIVNEGEGTFAAPRLFQAGSQPVAVAVGDINQDDVPDLAVSYTEPPRVLVFSSAP